MTLLGKTLTNAFIYGTYAILAGYKSLQYFILKSYAKFRSHITFQINIIKLSTALNKLHEWTNQ